jgi:hypothetical protein
MTQIRPRLDPDIAADVQAYTDGLSRQFGVRVSFSAAVNRLLRERLNTIKGDGTDENQS